MGVDLISGRMKSDGPVGIKPRSFIVDVAANLVRSKGCFIENKDMESLFDEIDILTSKDMLPLLRLLPGSQALLERLQQCGILSVIVSTDITERACRAMQVLQLDHYFTEIIGGDLVDNTKPSPDLAELALSRTGIDPTDAVIIGDHPVDIEMGINASISASIGVLTGLSDSAVFDNYECHVASDLTSLKVA